MLGPVGAIAAKDLRLLMRDFASVFFVFVFPIMVSLFFGAIFGGAGGDGGSGMDVALVNQAQGPASEAFAKDIVADDSLNVTTQGGTKEAPHPLTLEEGQGLVRRGAVSACVVIPKDFEEGATNMFAGGGMKVQAIVDPAHKAEAGLLTGKLNELAFKQMSRTFSDPSRMTASMKSAREQVDQSTGLSAEQKKALTDLFTSLDTVSAAKLPDPDAKTDAKGDKDQKATSGFGGWRPVDVEVNELSIDRSGQPTNAFEISFPQGVVWGLMGCMMAFGVALVTERTAGTMLRLLAAPITRREILLGKALACFITCVVVQIVLVAMGTAIGKLHIENWGMLGLAMVSCGVGFSGLMMVIAGLSKTEAAASGMARGVVIMLAMIGGGTVPLFMLPKTIRTFAGISPFKWANQAIEGAVWRHYSLHEMLLPVAVLLGMGVVGYLVGAGAMKKTLV